MKPHFRVLLSALGVLALLGCSTIDTTQGTKADSFTRLVSEQNYSLGATMAASVGEPLVSVRNYDERTISGEVMVASEAFTITHEGSEYAFRAGSKFVIEGVRKFQKVDYAIIKVVNGAPGSLQVGPDGAALNTSISVFSEIEYPITITPASVRFGRENTSVKLPKLSGLNYDLVFAGVDGSSMRFQFREYGGTSLTAPIASQEISFPLGTPQIQYRSLKIDIVSVSPTAVNFIVRQGLEAAEPGPMMISPAPPPAPPKPSI